MIMDEDNYIAHYGILRRSGRYPYGSGGNTQEYPWGSGATQTIRNRTFLDTINEMRRQGLSDTEICRGFAMSTTQLRAARTIARAEQAQSKITMA